LPEPSSGSARDSHRLPPVDQMAYYFYALRSRRDGKLYKGVAADVDARLAQHNGGKTKSLRHRRPLEVS